MDPTLNLEDEMEDFDFYEKNEKRASNLDKIIELEAKETITKLDADAKKLTIAQIDQLEQELVKMPELRILILNLSDSPLENDGMVRLAAMFEKVVAVAPKINKLHLNFMCCKAKDTGVKALAEKIATFPKLKDLKIEFRENAFAELGLFALAGAIQKLVKLTDLQLAFYKNDFQGQGILKLSQAIATLTKLEELDLDFRIKAFKKDYITKTIQLLSKVKITKKLKVEYATRDVPNGEQSDFRKGLEAMYTEANPAKPKNLSIGYTIL